MSVKVLRGPAAKSVKAVGHAWAAVRAPAPMGLTCAFAALLLQDACQHPAGAA